MARKSTTSTQIEAQLAFMEAVRQVCEARTREHINEYAKAAGVERPDQQFGELITDAVAGCVIEHRLGFMKRPSETRRQLSKIRETAKTTAESLQKLYGLLDRLDSQVLLVLAEKWGSLGHDRISKLPNEVDRFHGLAKLVDALLLSIEDKGGPKKYSAFGAFVRGLARAFEHGRGRPAGVTRMLDSPEYGGDFIQLLNATLPLAVVLAEASGAGQLGRPKSTEVTSNTLGKYIERLNISR